MVWQNWRIPDTALLLLPAMEERRSRRWKAESRCGPSSSKAGELLELMSKWKLGENPQVIDYTRKIALNLNLSQANKGCRCRVRQINIGMRIATCARLRMRDTNFR